MTFLYAPDSHELAHTELVNSQTAAIRVTSAVAGVSSDVMYQQDGNTIRVNWQGQFRNAYARDSVHKPFMTPTNITHDPHVDRWNLPNLGQSSVTCAFYCCRTRLFVPCAQLTLASSPQTAS
jgi:hypothetical protein